MADIHDIKQDTVIQTIKKLARLSQSPNEHEAALAQARMQELLAKHNLDMATIQDTPDATVEKREKQIIDRSAKFKWQKELWEALAKANFCWYWLQDIPVREPEKYLCYGCIAESNPVAGDWEDVKPRESEWVKCSRCKKTARCYRPKVPTKKRHQILGSLTNVTAVKLMGEYLEDTMTRVCPYKVGEDGLKTIGSRGFAARATNLWKSGCTERLVERIQEKARKMREAKGGTGTELTLYDVDKREYEKNYDALNGPGAYAQKLLDDAKWQKELEERRIKREKEWLEYLQNETPDQKAAREKREHQEEMAERRRQRARDRYYNNNWWRGSRRADTSKSEDDEYRAGRSAGDRIGIDPQVGKSESKRLA